MRHAILHLADIDSQTSHRCLRPRKCGHRVPYVGLETRVVGGLDDNPQFTHACEVEIWEDDCPVPFSVGICVLENGNGVATVGPEGVFGDFEGEGVDVEEVERFKTELAVDAADAGEVALEGRA